MCSISVYSTRLLFSSNYTVYVPEVLYQDERIYNILSYQRQSLVLMVFGTTYYYQRCIIIVVTNK